MSKRTTPVKEHKNEVSRDSFVRTLESRESRNLDALSDKELGRCARQVIEHVLRPGLRSDVAIAARTCQHILDQITLFYRLPKPHGSEKWRGITAVRLVAMVLRRTVRGQSLDEACAAIGENYALPIVPRKRSGTNTAIDEEVVKASYRRARASLKRDLVLSAVEDLVGAEYIRSMMMKGKAPPPMQANHRFVMGLPEPLLPPDFPLRDENEPPPWEPAEEVVTFLMEARDRHFLLAKNTKTQKA
jgi:Arc/MetJ family transcription regulator